MKPSNRQCMQLVGATLAGLIAATATPSAAAAQEPGSMIDPWFVTLEASAMAPLGDPLWHQFGVGLGGAAGVYYMITPELAIGGRVHAGFLSAGGVIAQDPVDRGVLDLGLLGVALRLRPFASMHQRDRRAAGFWIEAAPGPALSDGQVRFGYQIGLGYDFAVGPIAIGPVTRFIHVVEPDGRFGNNQLLVLTAGIEVAFPDELHRVPYPTPVAEPPTPTQPPPPADRDGDGILDVDDTCPDEPETFNGFQDEDGCPDQGRGEFVNDALVVDERVFFDFDRAELRPEGAAQLDAVVEHYRTYGDRYDRLEVSGHADSRGPAKYNMELSARRAEAVRAYLTAHGVPDAVLDLHAWGETQPAIPDATTEWEHQVNRRVEFLVVWQEGREPEGVRPVPHPTMPDHVDEAPPDHRDD